MPRVRLGLPALAALAMLAAASGARAAVSPPLAVGLIGGSQRPDLLLAQRSIDREWGPSDDSVYVEVDVPEWRSEGLAMAASGAIPGAGQAYAGQSSAVWFALAEVAGWTTRWLYQRRGHDLQDQAASYAGAPADTTSRWSFDRFELTTQQSSAPLRILYDQDRNVFYDMIGHDDHYLGGWMGEPSGTRASFTELRDAGDDRLRASHYAGVGIWLNHVAAGLDALRAARIHNLRLKRDYMLRLEGGFRQGSPSFSAALRRSF